MCLSAPARILFPILVVVLVRPPLQMQGCADTLQCWFTRLRRSIAIAISRQMSDGKYVFLFVCGLTYVHVNAGRPLWPRSANTTVEGVFLNCSSQISVLPFLLEKSASLKQVLIVTNMTQQLGIHSRRSQRDSVAHTSQNTGREGQR